MYVTPRTLLGIIRLAQAMAKLNFRDTVKQGDIDEAIRLMDFSIRSLKSQEGTRKEQRRNQAGQQQADQMTHLMHQVKDIYQRKGSKPMDVAEILT